MQAGTALAKDLMVRFADDTGLTSQRPARRYLWTDAFAVCNFLALDRTTAERRYLELALRLVEQVHATLGRHRTDDARRGWISGLHEADSRAHPTRGGLRIGKPLPERGEHDRFDEELEWERDGQYFHYLTKWMHALDRVANATSQPVFASWARELAVTAHQRFAYEAPGRAKRMYWKMSTDLSRPLVASMGHHDPLDGLIMCLELEATARAFATPSDPALAAARADYAAMIDIDRLATTDPLGLGGLLADAGRLLRSVRGGEWRALLEAMLTAAGFGLQRYTMHGERQLPAERRLAFRELGLAIGLADVAPMLRHARDHHEDAIARRLAALDRFVPLRAEIEAFWTAPEHRAVASWTEHADINDVMLASSLLAPIGL